MMMHVSRGTTRKAEEDQRKEWLRKERLEEGESLSFIEKVKRKVIIII